VEVLLEAGVEPGVEVGAGAEVLLEVHLEAGVEPGVEVDHAGQVGPGGQRCGRGVVGSAELAGELVLGFGCQVGFGVGLGVGAWPVRAWRSGHAGGVCEDGVDAEDGAGHGAGDDADGHAEREQFGGGEAGGVHSHRPIR
jgi:hypothetical protein